MVIGNWKHVVERWEDYLLSGTSIFNELCGCIDESDTQSLLLLPIDGFFSDMQANEFEKQERNHF